MSYNILGINFSHNSSVCVLKDGKVDFFLEEDRLSRIKSDEFPDTLIRYISKHYSINEISLSGVSQYPSIFLNYNKDRKNIFNSIICTDNKLTLFDEDEKLEYTIPSLLKPLFDKYFPKIPVNDYRAYHHDTHALVSFLNSPFKESIVIVIDGTGSPTFNKNLIKFETETTYVCKSGSYPKVINKGFREYYIDEVIKTYPSLCHVYYFITRYLGFQMLEEGKTMGLSSYGKPNPSIPRLIINGRGNPEIFKPNKTENILSDIKDPIYEKYHYLFKDIETCKDVAYRLQKDVEIEVGNLIEKTLKTYNSKNICLSGGLFLNCVANYKFKKRFPDVNFYVEPLSSDTGLSMGVAKASYLFKDKLNSLKQNQPQKSIYYGPKYSRKELLKKIDKYLD